MYMNCCPCEHHHTRFNVMTHAPAYNVHAVARVLPEAPATLELPSLPRPVRRKELKFLLFTLRKG